MSKSVEELFRDAPEGTTHWDASDSRVNSFMKLEGDMWFYWPPASLDPSWNEWGKGGNQDVRCMIPRPQPKPWSGPEDGLPPVDSLVMVHECTHDYTKQFNDQTVRIVAHDQGKYAVFAADNFVYHALVAEKFKLPPTPEQLAAEERERAINDAIQELCISYKLASVMYDAGFKREVK